MTRIFSECDHCCKKMKRKLYTYRIAIFDLRLSIFVCNKTSLKRDDRKYCWLTMYFKVPGLFVSISSVLVSELHADSHSNIFQHKSIIVLLFIHIHIGLRITACLVNNVQATEEAICIRRIWHNRRKSS